MVDVDCDDEGNVGEVNVVVVQSATEEKDLFLHLELCFALTINSPLIISFCTNVDPPPPGLVNQPKQ